MESDDLRPLIPAKRSPSPVENVLPLTDTKNSDNENLARRHKRMHVREDQFYESSFMASHNPMSRKTQRIQAKRRRKDKRSEDKQSMQVETPGSL